MQAWVFVDALKKGTEKQCVGLAEALGCQDILVIPVFFPDWCKWLPSRVLRYLAKIPGGPAPDLVISGGRQAAALGAACKVRFQQIPCFHILNPYGLQTYFDAVIVPDHDQLQGVNVLTMMGALHNLTDLTLKAAGLYFEPLWKALPRPYHGVLIGGSNKSHHFKEPEWHAFLKAIDLVQDGTLIVSVSRRTPPNFIPYIQAFLKDRPHIFWHPEDGTDNPYEGMLALCDDFLVTSDSISMITEVAFTGKPIYLFELPTQSKKFSRFYNSLRDKNVLSTPGKLPNTYIPLNEKKRITQILKKFLVTHY